jgi:arylsulfatase A-like enzyme
VILVDWDGFDPDYLGRAPTPNIDSLAGRGSLSVADGVYPTISNPARASMSTGAYPETHGNAAYFFDDGAGEVVGETRFLDAETITQALAAEGRTTAAVQWYMVQDHGASYGDPEHLYVRPGGLFEQRVDAAVEILNRRPVDSAAEMVTVPKIPTSSPSTARTSTPSATWRAPRARTSGPLVAQLDRQLGRIVQAAKEVGVYERTALYPSPSDHGMTSWEALLLRGARRDARYRPRGGECTPGTRAFVPGDPRSSSSERGRITDVTLRGRSATGREADGGPGVLEGLPQISRVLDAANLETLTRQRQGSATSSSRQGAVGFGLAEPEEGASRGGHGSTRRCGCRS